MPPPLGKPTGPLDRDPGVAEFIEVLHPSSRAQAFIWGLGVATGGLSLGISATVPPLGPIDALIALVSLGLCGMVSRMSSVVTVGTRGIRLGFRIGGIPCWWRRLSTQDIARVERSAASALSAGGLGLRFLGGGHVALMVRQGEAIRIVHTDGWREYVIVTARADELERALSSLAAPPRAAPPRAAPPR